MVDLARARVPLMANLWTLRSVEKEVCGLRKRKGIAALGGVHVLDVKLRSQQARAIRWRRASRLVGAAWGDRWFFLLWQAGNWLLKYFIFESNAFAILSIKSRPMVTFSETGTTVGGSKVGR
jgi:hypothetical protein